MAKTQICPTCELEQPEDRAPLAYFAGIGISPTTADSIECAFYETSRLITFLSAAAAVGHLAATQDCELWEGEQPEWLGNWSFLVEELEGEAHRRLERLRKAGELWRERAKEK